MKNGRKSALWFVVAAVALTGAFAAGRWSARLKESLAAEASYPWELHRRIGNADIRCETLSAPGDTGKFFVRVLDDGNTLVVASLNRDRNAVTAYALDISGKFASDNWPLECK